MWANDYTDIEFKYEGREKCTGLDCWGLVRLVYLELLNIELPEYITMPKGSDISHIRSVVSKIREVADKWEIVDNPQEFDVLLMKPTGGLACHIGVMIDNRRFLHVEEGCNSTIDYIDGMRWKNRIEGFYRYV